MATRHAPRLARAAEGALKMLFPETYDRLKQRRYEGITD